MKDNSLKEFVLEQLRDLDEVAAKPMFGGFGLYQGRKFFGLVTRNDVVYFKTNEETRQDYIDLGSDVFRPSEKQTLKNYYEVPGEILDDREKIVSWAERAVDLK